MLSDFMLPDFDLFISFFDSLRYVTDAGRELAGAFINLLGRLWDFIREIARAINSLPSK